MVVTIYRNKENRNKYLEVHRYFMVLCRSVSAVL